MTLFQGSFLLSVGAELDFVSSSSAKNHQGITIKLLKVDLDYTINERYRFFVPKIEETAMRCYQNEEVICGIGDRRSRSSSADDSSERVLTLNKVLTIVEIESLQWQNIWLLFARVDLSSNWRVPLTFSYFK